MKTISSAPLIALVSIVSIHGCTKDQASGNSHEKVLQSRGSAEKPTWRFTEKGDIPALRKRGVLRLLMARQHLANRRPRGDFPPDHEEKLAEEFARELGLSPVVVYTPSHDQLLPWIEHGKRISERGRDEVYNADLPELKKKDPSGYSQETPLQDIICTRAYKRIEKK